MLYDLLPSWCKRYRLAAALDGHKDAVFSLAISNSGRYLASGGADGAKIWDMSSYKELRTPDQGREHRGQVVGTSWVSLPSDKHETLCFTTGLGYLVFWDQDNENRFEEIFSHRVANGKEITCLTSCIAEDGQSVRIAFGTRDKAVQVWSLDHKRHVSTVFSKTLANTIPVSIEILRNVSRDVRVFGLYDGSVCLLHGSEGNILAAKIIGSAIGGAASCEKDDLLVVDNMISGFSLHKLSDGAYIRGYPTQVSGRAFIKAVGFLENSRVVVGGSDHGIVYLFDRDTGETIDTLRHADGGLVQIIATHQYDGISLIASASSETSRKGRITIWTYKTSGGGTRVRFTIGSLLQLVWQVLVILTILVVFWPFLQTKIPTEMAEWVTHARLKAAEHTTHWAHPAAAGTDRAVVTGDSGVDRGGAAAELRSEIIEMREMMERLLRSQAEQRALGQEAKMDSHDGLTGKGFVLVANEVES